jgi:hypothetical protein
MEGEEEREITCQMQVWDVADGSGTEWSQAAAGQGHHWQPQLMEVFQNVVDGGCNSMKARNISPSTLLHICSELHRGRTWTAGPPPLPPV